jgi:hypothetical protein
MVSVRDVTFDETRGYNPDEPEITVQLRETVEETLETIEIPRSEPLGSDIDTDGETEIEDTIIIESRHQEEEDTIQERPTPGLTEDTRSGQRVDRGTDARTATTKSSSIEQRRHRRNQHRRGTATTTADIDGRHQRDGKRLILQPLSNWKSSLDTTPHSPPGSSKAMNAYTETIYLESLEIGRK